MNASKDFLEFEDLFTTELACVLIFSDEYGSPPMFRQDLHFGIICKSYHYGGVSLEQQICVTLYPKVATMERCSLSNSRLYKINFRPLQKIGRCSRVGSNRYMLTIIQLGIGMLVALIVRGMWKTIIFV